MAEYEFRNFMVMSFKPTFVKAIVLFVSFGLGVLGTSMLVLSFLSFEEARAAVDTFAHDGNCERFNFLLFTQIVFRARLIGVVLIVLSGSLFVLRNNVCENVLTVINSSTSMFQELTKQFCYSLRKEDKKHLYVVLLILLLGVLVRLFFLFQPIRYDEAFTFVNFASKPIYRGLSDYSYPNNHLFHTLLVRLAYLFFGNQTWIIRLPAFIAGILIVPAAYVVMRIYSNKMTALLTAGLVAASPSLIFYSTNARGYTLVSFIFLLRCFTRF